MELHFKRRLEEFWKDAISNSQATTFDNISDYPCYQRKGFHIGSGVAEGACKHVIQSRFKRTGMRWSRPGAENLLALRNLHVNDHWELLQNYQQN